MINETFSEPLRASSEPLHNMLKTFSEAHRNLIRISSETLRRLGGRMYEKGKDGERLG